MICINKKSINLIILAIILLPLTVSAASGGALDELVQKITRVLNSLITILFALATVYFFWGIILYVIGVNGDVKQLDRGKQHILWGIIGMVIMLSAWGIVRMVKSFLGV